MAAIFGKRNYFFLKIANSLLGYPVGRKFRRNHSIWHSYGDRSKSVFWQKLKMALIFKGRKIFGQLEKSFC